MIRSERGMEGSVNATGVYVGMVGQGVGDGGRGGGVEGVLGKDSVGSAWKSGVAVGKAKVARAIGVFVAMAPPVSAAAVLTVEIAVSMISAWLSVGAGRELLQEASSPAARNKGMNILPKMFILPYLLMSYKETPNARRNLETTLQTSLQSMPQ